MATALPTPRQLEYQDWDLGMFLHFGLRTFYEGYRDFDERKMSPDRFLPSDLDCDQWTAVAESAGMRYLVLTAKHHDGFANWPSKTTDFSVSSSSWRDGRGDVVGEFVAACRRRGMAAGLYYSPFDAASPVYDDPRAYDDYFITQISELLEPYGPLDILWFDGCGSQHHTYDWPRIVGEIRRMQPNLLIFNMGDPDFRWVGNESGLAPLPCWNTVDEVDFAMDTSAKERVAGGRCWLPAECDARVRYQNWFYSDQDEPTVKSLEELLGLYYYSVGRGCNLLLNVGPDRRGQVAEADAHRLAELGAEIRRRFGSPRATLPEFTRADNVWEHKPAEPMLLDHLVVQEDIAAGEHVRRFAVVIQPTHGHMPIAVYEGRNVGHKAICRFPLVKARTVRFEVTEADGPVELRSLSLHQGG